MSTFARRRILSSDSDFCSFLKQRPLRCLLRLLRFVSAPRTRPFNVPQTVMHVGPFLCQRGRCCLGSCLCLGIRLVCVFSARTVVAVIGAATGTFVAVVFGEGMVGARVGTFALALGLATCSPLPLPLSLWTLQFPLRIKRWWRLHPLGSNPAFEPMALCLQRFRCNCGSSYRR